MIFFFYLSYLILYNNSRINYLTYFIYGNQAIIPTRKNIFKFLKTDKSNVKY